MIDEKKNALSFHKENFSTLCDLLSKKDMHLKNIVRQYGYPPMWTRPANFQTLILIILEQQVSLASAKAAFLKLKEKLGTITPGKLLQLTDAELKACYFSRQKIVYARHLATAIVSKQLNLERLSLLPDEKIREELKRIKGIGDWTVDIYLLFALQRTDIFPTGDLAMMNAFKEIKQLEKQVSKEEVIVLSQNWKPHRSVATMMLWHYYIQKRGLRGQEKR
ncbi:MAG: DNA-3-methyladenine glycosylase family protein [Chitinophagaceae bacterium]